MTIEINNLQFSYTDSPNANLVDIPKLHIAKGEQLLINGPSGCGKSTLLNLICGMLSPTQGEITVLNTRIDSLRAHQRDRFRAKHIGYVFQQFNLIPYLNAIDNIKLASYFSKNDTKQNIVEITQLLADLNVAE